MTVSQTPSSVAASDRSLSAADRKRRRHKVARRLYEALVAQDPNRGITLCDEAGNVLARYDPLPEHDPPKIASLTHVPLPAQQLFTADRLVAASYPAQLLPK